METYKKWISILSWFIGGLIVWELVAYFLDSVFMDPLAEKKVPYIQDVVILFSKYGISVLHEAAITLSRAGIGFLWGAGIGILLAILMNLSKVVEKIAMPYLLLSQMIPILGLAPIIFGLVKDQDASRTIISAYITFFPVSVSLLSGLKSCESEKKMLMDSYAATKWDLYVKLLMPHSLPYLFVGLKIAAPTAVTASILVDTLSSKNGIGYIIVLALYGGGTTGKFWPAVIVASLLGVFSFVLIAELEYLMIPWQRKQKRGVDDE